MKQKNFDEVYEEINNSNTGSELNKMRKTIFLKESLLFISVFAIAIYLINLVIHNDVEYIYIPIILEIVTIVVFLLSVMKWNKKYQKDYKEEIINELVKKSNLGYKYLYKEGIGSWEYAESKFDSGWDLYSTEDLIEGAMDDGTKFKMAQVHTQNEHTSTDSDGTTTTTYVTTFLGLYGIIDLDTDTNVDFMIKENSKFLKFNKQRIEMESAEFEKFYDVFSLSKDGENRQNTMELLTPETIEKFVEIRNIFKKSINVRVYNHKIYFRIWVGDIFEPPTFKNCLDYKMLYKYFLIIDVPRMIYETLIDNILVMHGDTEAIEKRNKELKNEQNL